MMDCMTVTSRKAHDAYGAPVCFEEELMTGTTIMACEFEGGVMIGADSRTSSGTYIANRAADKLSKVTDYIYCCRSGSAADTQAVLDIVAYQLNFYRNETNEEPTVEIAANVFRDVYYRYRDQLQVGLIIAGWDKVKGGQVYNIPLGGMVIRQKFCMGGSGSTFVFGFTDTNFKENMTEAECKNFLTRAIGLAISRDGSSGGVIRLGQISEKGISRDVIKYCDISESIEGLPVA
uniref:proteasome endopeptidase complex n=1 Tax=Lygus hesperus TaxID=30085 RepID=A0A0A9XLW1_LYGHE